MGEEYSQPWSAGSAISIAAANRGRASTARTQYLTIRAMHWKPHLPEIFLGISLGMIAIEAALGSVAAVKARYRASHTFASVGTQGADPYPSRPSHAGLVRIAIQHPLESPCAS